MNRKIEGWNESKMYWLGNLSALVLEIVCEHPEDAYATALCRIFLETHDDKTVNLLDIGHALKALVEEKLLATIPGKSKGNGRTVEYYRPTWRAGFVHGCKGLTICKPYTVQSRRPKTQSLSKMLYDFWITEDITKYRQNTVTGLIGLLEKNGINSVSALKAKHIEIQKLVGMGPKKKAFLAEFLAAH